MPAPEQLLGTSGQYPRNVGDGGHGRLAAAGAVGRADGRAGRRRAEGGRGRLAAAGAVGRADGRAGRRRAEHQVAVGAAHAERADPGHRRQARGGPRAAVRHHPQPQLVQGDRRVGRGEMQARGQLAAGDAQRDLQQPGDARGALQVADVGLHRADEQRLLG